MSKTQETLRMAGKFLWLVGQGYEVTREEAKTMADLCWLALPTKYRMTRAEIIYVMTKAGLASLDDSDDNRD